MTVLCWGVGGGKKLAGCIRCGLKTLGRKTAPAEASRAGAVASGGEGKHGRGCCGRKSVSSHPSEVMDQDLQPPLVQGMGHGTSFLLFY